MATETTRLFAEADVHELMLRAYANGYLGANDPEAPDPYRDDGVSAVVCEEIRSDYTPREPITEEVVARSHAQKLAALASLAAPHELIDMLDERVVWDWLHENGLVRTFRDMTGEGHTEATEKGARWLRENV